MCAQQKGTKLQIVILLCELWQLLKQMSIFYYCILPVVPTAPLPQETFSPILAPLYYKGGRGWCLTYDW